MKFYKRDPDAALAGMAELTLQERGAYNTIIDLLYSRDGVLPDDDEMLRRVLACHGNEWRGVKARLVSKGKLWIEGGHLKAKRVDSVLKEAGNFSETQRIRAGNRWENEWKRLTKAKKAIDYQGAEDAMSRNANTPTPTPTPIKERKKEGGDAANGKLEFPDWWPSEAWGGFVAMRRKTDRGKPLSDYAIKLLVRELAALRASGQDPERVVEQSVMKNWKGFFALPAANGNGHANGVRTEIEWCPKSEWASRLKFWTDNPSLEVRWRKQWGPPPNDPACVVPKDVLAMYAKTA